MSELDDQNSAVFVTELTEDAPVAQTLPAWETLLADTHFLLSDATDTDTAAATQELIGAAQAALTADPTRPIVIAKGWPAVSTAGLSQNSLSAWQIAVAAHEAAYRDLIDSLQSALPNATIQSFDLANVLADMLTDTVLEELDVATFFTSEAPSGTAVLTDLAGLIVQTAQAVQPIGPAEDLSAELLLVYYTLSLDIWQAVGAQLADTPEPLPQPSDDPVPDDQEIPPPPTLLGSAADDTIIFADALTQIDGGAGFDTLVMLRQAETMTLDVDPATGTLRLTQADGSGSAQVDNVERVAFSDGTFAFDADGVAGQAYRLYQACFDRTPDAEGLGFWIKQMDAGNVTLHGTAGHFLASAEFATVYGDPAELSDLNYLALLYANVLGRTPDAAGFDFWRTQQDNGISRADMLVAFSESVENVALVAPAIDDGIWYL